MKSAIEHRIARFQALAASPLYALHNLLMAELQYCAYHKLKRMPPRFLQEYYGAFYL